MTEHEMVFMEFQYPTDTRAYWEMHCSCGAWQHGTREEVEHTAAVHRVERGEPSP